MYLYVKQHIITGMKYFGKTTKEDPYQYQGSGKYWNKHIEKHGREHVVTLYVWEFDSQLDCTDFALEYSKEHDIVKSNQWANLKEENGLDGNPKGSVFCRNKLTGDVLFLPKETFYSSDIYEGVKKGRKVSDQGRKNISESQKGKVIPDDIRLKISNAPGHRSDETRRKKSESHLGKSSGMLGKKHSEETKKLMAHHGETNGMYGKRHSIGSLEKISAAARNRKKIKCRCGVEATAANYKRWHGDNCKSK